MKSALNGAFFMELVNPNYFICHEGSKAQRITKVFDLNNHEFTNYFFCHKDSKAQRITKVFDFLLLNFELS